MLYLWQFPENYLDKLTAVYEEQDAINRYLFLQGNELISDKVNKRFLFKINSKSSEILQYDCVASNIDAPIINQKVVDILLKLAPDEAQFFDIALQCVDGTLSSYRLLNITSVIEGIDHEKSNYLKIINTDAILRFKYLTYKPGCMRGYKLARDKEYLGNLLVTEEIKQEFELTKIKGVRFIRPEEFYRPLRPEDLVD